MGGGSHNETGIPCSNLGATKKSQYLLVKSRGLALHENHHKTCFPTDGLRMPWVTHGSFGVVFTLKQGSPEEHVLKNNPNQTT